MLSEHLEVVPFRIISLQVFEHALIFLTESELVSPSKRLISFA